MKNNSKTRLIIGTYALTTLGVSIGVPVMSSSELREFRENSIGAQIQGKYGRDYFAIIDRNDDGEYDTIWRMRMNPARIGGYLSTVDITDDDPNFRSELESFMNYYNKTRSQDL